MVQVLGLLGQTEAEQESDGHHHRHIPVEAVFHTYGLQAQRHVFRLAHEHGCDVLEVREDDWVGRREVELSNTFLLRKR